MTVRDFVARVQMIAASAPSYRTGGDGRDGTCDCIGLVMGATGRAYPMHSTNYFTRFEMAELSPINTATPLQAGQLVYKARDAAHARYDLHQRYMAGGRYYTGDLLDYYHVGVVTGADPLEITHCTSSGAESGIVRDTSAKGWTHAGWLEELRYEDDADMDTKATVMADSGTTVNLRVRPDVDSGLIERVPIGSTVDVLEQADGWAKVRYSGYIGYMMSRYLLGLEELPFADDETDASFEEEILERLDEIIFLLKGGEG